MVTSTNVRSLVVGGLLVSLSPVQSPQPSPSIVVVVDSTSVVRDRARATAQVRTLLTVAAANPASVTCIDLQAKDAEVLNDCLIESHITDLFPEERRVYPGVSLDLREANAILARNEAVRDQVIGRECAAARRSSGCEGAVHGAAVARLADAQSETERKLAALAGVIGTRHPTLVILVSAGMPFRYEPTAVRRLVDVLRTGRTQLVHAAPESPFKIEGLLRDAAAMVVSNAGGRRVNLTDTAAGLVELLPAAPTEPPAMAPPAGSTDGAVLRMARAYAARYPAEIKFITAHERYEQEVRSRAGSFGATAGRITARRSTEASVTFAHVTDSLWIMTREVLSVDGRTLPGTPPPRINEPQSEGEVLRALRAAADDGARWNIGNVQRNINTPTLVLWFLEEPIAQRFQFQVSGTERTAAGTCRIIRYHELARPPLMAVNGSRVPTSGKIWVLPDSGAIVRTQLVLEHTIPSNRGPIVASRATITVDYMPYADADLWVPAMMTERYEEPGSRESETVLATAKYSDYKRFRVSSKVK